MVVGGLEPIRVIGLGGFWMVYFVILFIMVIGLDV